MDCLRPTRSPRLNSPCRVGVPRRRGLTLVEIMVSFALLLAVSAGILASIMMAVRIQQRSRLRAEAFNVAGFIADQVRYAGQKPLHDGALGVGGISIRMPGSVTPIYSSGLTISDTNSSKYALAPTLTITPNGTTYGGVTADIRSATANYEQAWSAGTPGPTVNVCQTDLRAQDLVNLAGTRYQLTAPWVSGRDKSGAITTFVVVMVTENNRTNINGTSFIDYMVRVDVAFDPKQLPGNQPIVATARAYMTPAVVVKPNVLLVK